MAKGEIARFEQILLWSECRLLQRRHKASTWGKGLKLHLYLLKLWNWKKKKNLHEHHFSFCHSVFKSHLLLMGHYACASGKELKPFPSYDNSVVDDFEHILSNNGKSLYYWMDNLWLKVENIVTKGEIARYVQFLLLLLSFQKAVCCRGIRKRLYEGKG